MCQTVGGPQRHSLDRARGLAEVDDVADAELVLDQDEHARQEVAHQRLGAEADRHAEDAGARQQRGEVEADLAEAHEQRDEPDHERHDAAQHAREGVDPLLRAHARLARLQQRGRGAAAHRAHPLPHRAAVQAGQRALDGAPRQPVEDGGREQDQDDLQRRSEQPVGEVGHGLLVEHPVEASNGFGGRSDARRGPRPDHLLLLGGTAPFALRPCCQQAETDSPIGRGT
jgi:hypothetical protein